MVSYGEPQIVMFGTGNKKGYTLVQLIETSNICAHFVEESNDMYLDVFSCKTFDPHVVKHMVNFHFQPSHMKHLLLSRDASEPMKML
jgi:S-adenosylmethionine/arginine decarboxylase-like enzyme